MTRAPGADGVGAAPHRFRLHRLGVLNVWQYDEQVFDFSDGRMLLRGANGAGKSKTLEMLLPFALDGDKLRITASGRHHTSLLWLMTDGYDGNRTGYVWVEFARDTDQGEREFFTCGIGIRASSSAKAATSWHFTSPRQVGVDLRLEDEAGPLSKERCRLAVADGAFFEQARSYKQHVGRTLFGLEPTQYDELLRLLYWLRQPQIGEDIEPAKLADQLAQALPQVDDEAIRSAGDTFDELAAFGEQIERRQRAAEAVAAFAETYTSYARAVARARGAALLQTHGELGRCRLVVDRARAELARTEGQVDAVEQDQRATGARLTHARATMRELEASPEARSQQHLLDLEARAADLADAAGRAARAAALARDRADIAQRRVGGDGESLRGDLTTYSREAADCVAAAIGAGVAAPMPLPAALASPGLTDGDGAERLRTALVEHAAAASAVSPAIGELLALVQVVDQTRRESDAADTRRDTEERRSAEAESRAEQDRGRFEDARASAGRAEESYAEALDAWRADPRSPLPGATGPPGLTGLTASTVVTVASAARAGADPVLDALREDESAAGAARVTAERSLESLRTRRREIEAEHDPAPGEPALGRCARGDLDGSPLWRLVDFPETMPAADRAGIEAALESAGLLDAWVRADGDVLDASGRDVVLPRGPRERAPTLADVLVVDEPAGPVAAEVVRDVLARVAVGTGPAPGADPGACVDLDGSWRLGPLVGRAVKHLAQYVGATARAAERARRLAEVDERLTTTDQARSAAASAETAARVRRQAIEAWLADVPPHHDLLAAWTRLDERGEAARRAEAAAGKAEEQARQARSEAASRRRALEETAARHGLPTSAGALSARREELRTLERRVARHADQAGLLGQRLARWAQDWTGWRSDVEQVAQLEADSATQTEAAQGIAAQRDTLREAVGASIAELRSRLADTRRVIEGAGRRERELKVLSDGLREAVGAVRTALRTADERLVEQQQPVAEAAHALAVLRDVPGLMRSALEREVDADDAVAFEQARGVTAGEKVPGSVVALGRRLAALAEPSRPGDAAALYAAWRDVSSSDAADHEPRVVQMAGSQAAGVGQASGDVLAALGRDDGGEHPVAVLGERLAAALAQDRELLTERERSLFEEHLLGDLGEMLRRRRLEAVELVEGMNRLLVGVTTSQGIAVRLQWRLRDDVAEDARRAITLLGQPVGALLPDERAELRESMHRLIEASRSETPEDSYAEHLARALDYRRWFAFRIRYTRPELEGRWQDLHRRSPLSQGEQKVVCYLPLFAAAAAHFTSLAGAAPNAPRFILLDDAFPKIDVRTHPLLFGLLVSFDLDFVVTSERLWGDHATLPSLAIYEALRDPAERGIAQYRYLWDGARLQAVGA